MIINKKWIRIKPNGSHLHKIMKIFRKEQYYEKKMENNICYMFV